MYNKKSIKINDRYHTYTSEIENQDNCYDMKIRYAKQNGETIETSISPNGKILVNDYIAISELYRIA